MSCKSANEADDLPSYDDAVMHGKLSRHVESIPSPTSDVAKDRTWRLSVGGIAHNLLLRAKDSIDNLRGATKTQDIESDTASSIPSQESPRDSLPLIRSRLGYSPASSVHHASETSRSSRRFSASNSLRRVLTNASKRSKRGSIMGTLSRKLRMSEMPVGPDAIEDSDDASRSQSESPCKLDQVACQVPLPDNVGSRAASPIKQDSDDDDTDDNLDKPINKPHSPPPVIHLDLESVQLMSPTTFNDSDMNLERVPPPTTVLDSTYSRSPHCDTPVRRTQAPIQLNPPQPAEYVPRRGSGDHWKMRKVNMSRPSLMCSQEDLVPTDSAKPTSPIPINRTQVLPDAPLPDPGYMVAPSLHSTPAAESSTVDWFDPTCISAKLRHANNSDQNTVRNGVVNTSAHQPHSTLDATDLRDIESSLATITTPTKSRTLPVESKWICPVFLYNSSAFSDDSLPACNASEAELSLKSSSEPYEDMSVTCNHGSCSSTTDDQNVRRDSGHEQDSVSESGSMMSSADRHVELLSGLATNGIADSDHLQSGMESSHHQLINSPESSESLNGSTPRLPGSFATPKVDRTLSATGSPSALPKSLAYDGARHQVIHRHKVNQEGKVNIRDVFSAVTEQDDDDVFDSGDSADEARICCTCGGPDDHTCRWPVRVNASVSMKSNATGDALTPRNGMLGPTSSPALDSTPRAMLSDLRGNDLQAAQRGPSPRPEASFADMKPKHTYKSIRFKIFEDELSSNAHKRFSGVDPFNAWPDIHADSNKENELAESGRDHDSDADERSSIDDTGSDDNMALRLSVYS